MQSEKKSPFQLRMEMENADNDCDFNLPSPQLVEKANVPTFSFPPLSHPLTSPCFSLTPPPTSTSFRLKRPLPSPGLMKKQTKGGFGGKEMRSGNGVELSLLSPSAQAYGLTFLDKPTESCRSRALPEDRWFFVKRIRRGFPHAFGLASLSPSPPATPFPSHTPRCRLRKLHPA